MIVSPAAKWRFVIFSATSVSCRGVRLLNRSIGRRNSQIRSASCRTTSDMIRPSTIWTRRSAEFDDPVIVGDHHDRRAVLDGHLLQQADDVHRRILVERRGRLVGEDQPWMVDEGAADRDPLAFAARQEPRLVVDAVAEPEALQDFGAALAHIGAMTRRRAAPPS